LTRPKSTFLNRTCEMNIRCKKGILVLSRGGRRGVGTGENASNE